MSLRSDTLHCVVRSPRDGEAFALALALVAPGDGVLLLQDGVWAAADSSTTLPAGVCGYVLAGDLMKRGIGAPINPHFSVIDEASFVALAANAARQVCWA